MSDRILVDAKNTVCPGPLMELISNMKNELLYLIKTEGYKKVSEVIGKSV